MKVLAAMFLLLVPGPLVLCPFDRSFAANPSTRPTAPTTRASADIHPELKRAFLQLADPAPERREAAKIDLMGMSINDLSAVIELMQEHSALARSQAGALHEVVLHLYAKSIAYEVEENKGGFLGIGMGPPELADDPETAGVVVQDRYAGFEAFRYLQDGDVLLGLEEVPGKLIRTNDDLAKLVGARSAGEIIHLQIMRGGRILTFPMKLSERPVVKFLQQPGNPPITTLTRRQQDAEAFWSKLADRLIDDDAL